MGAQPHIVRITAVGPSKCLGDTDVANPCSTAPAEPVGAPDNEDRDTRQRLIRYRRIDGALHRMQRQRRLLSLAHIIGDRRRCPAGR